MATPMIWSGVGMDEYGSDEATPVWSSRRSELQPASRLEIECRLGMTLRASRLVADTDGVLESDVNQTVSISPVLILDRRTRRLPARAPREPAEG